MYRNTRNTMKQMIALNKNYNEEQHLVSVGCIAYDQLRTAILTRDEIGIMKCMNYVMYDVEIWFI